MEDNKIIELYFSRDESAIRETSSITRKELAEQLQCSDSTIKRNLASLVNKGIIERVGSDKTGSWLIKTLNN